MNIVNSFDKIMMPDYTGNPNECWYEDENGKMTPCVIESVNPTTKFVFSSLAYVALVVDVFLLIVIYRKMKNKN